MSAPKTTRASRDTMRVTAAVGALGGSTAGRSQAPLRMGAGIAGHPAWSTATSKAIASPRRRARSATDGAAITVWMMGCSGQSFGSQPPSRTHICTLELRRSRWSTSCSTRRRVDDVRAVRRPPASWLALRRASRSAVGTRRLLRRGRPVQLQSSRRGVVASALRRCRWFDRHAVAGAASNSSTGDRRMSSAASACVPYSQRSTSPGAMATTERLSC
jgi:hypothetical protein